MSSLNRTYHPKWVTYTGDGKGRDNYIVFDNGGLNELRVYNGPQYNGFKNNGTPVNRVAAPRRDATAFDYKPDGSGRDLYIIRNFGLKRNYQSHHRDHERSLREPEATPIMDSRQKQTIRSGVADITNYLNWPSPKQRRRDQKTACEQRESIQKLSQSPRSKSPKFCQLELKEAYKISSVKDKKFSLPTSTIAGALRTQVLENAKPEIKSVFLKPKMSYQPLSVQTDYCGLDTEVFKNNRFSTKRTTTCQPSPLSVSRNQIADKAKSQKPNNFEEDTDDARRKNCQTALQMARPSYQETSKLTPMSSIEVMRQNLRTQKNTRGALGHNTALDDFSYDKIVDNDPFKFGQVRPSPPLEKLRMQLIN